MRTSQKLWLGFGILTALLVLFSTTIILRLHSIEANVEAQSKVARPRSGVTRELEISVLDYAINVHEHLHGANPVARQTAIGNAANVRRLLVEYRQLAINDRQHQLANEFDAIWQPMLALGQAILDADRAADPATIASFHQIRLRVGEFLDHSMHKDAVDRLRIRTEATFQDVYFIEALSVTLLVIGALIAIAASGAVGRGIVQTDAELRRMHGELEGRVQERTTKLMAANESLERSNRELEQFASAASHDLQEPLRKIQAFGDRLQAKFGDQLGQQGHEYVERILSSAGRMRNLIDDLLTFSRVTTKAQASVAIDLNVVLQEVLSDLEARVHQTRGRVEVGNLPTVNADPLQMRQLLQNLIANALKFHRPDEPPVVFVSGRHILDAEARPWWEITVKDNGIGFEEIYLDRIFEVFQRLHGRNEYEGTGVGLAICRKIVERHHGHITAHSAPGQGSMFVVTLPANRTPEQATP
ncbi:MAG TPA: ATP-binding protein [Burkholderiaceae bacterium]|nr:ATP-binding protein [Burkholderiaceae bacterium]